MSSFSQRWALIMLLAGALALSQGGCPDTTIPSLRTGSARVCDADELSAFRAASTDSERSDLWIAFVDVGHGDAAWIRTPGIRDLDAKEILIDSGGCRFVDRSCGALSTGGGEDDYNPNGIGALIEFMSESGWPAGSPIDLLMVTHPDQDHYGGSWRLLAEYQVRRFLDPGGESTGPLWSSLLAQVTQLGSVYQSPAAEVGIGVSLEGELETESWGRNVEARLLSADAGATESNNRSIVVLLESLGNRILFLGDAEEPLDTRLVAGGLDPIDVLKAGHHGGRGTNSEALLDAVFPEERRGGLARYAIISAGGKDQLPAEETVERLRDRVGDFGLYRTDRGDSEKAASETPGDDHILLRIRADGELTLCYAYPDERPK